MATDCPYLVYLRQPVPTVTMQNPETLVAFQWTESELELSGGQRVLDGSVVYDDLAACEASKTGASLAMWSGSLSNMRRTIRETVARLGP